MASSRFFSSNFSFFVLEPCFEKFFLLFSNLLLVFRYLAFFFFRSSWLGVPHFFLSLSWVLFFSFSTSSFGGLVSNIFFSNLLLVFQYLAFFFSLLFLVRVPHFFLFFFLSLELSSFLSVVSFFGLRSTVCFLGLCFWSWYLYFPLFPPSL